MESFTRRHFVRSGMAATTAALLTSSWLRAESLEVAPIFAGNRSDTDDA